MEASLIDMTRGLEMYVPLFPLEVEIELVHDDDDGDDYDVVIEYVFERAPIEDAFVDPWFAVHDDMLADADDLPFPPITTPRSLHAVLGFAAAVAVAACLYGATL